MTTVDVASVPDLDRHGFVFLVAAPALRLSYVPPVASFLERIDTGPPIDLVIALRVLLI